MGTYAEQPVQAQIDHPAPKIINLVGPTVIVALAATLFMSDYVYKITLGAHFYADPAMTDPSLQTMAEGYFTLSWGTGILVSMPLTWHSLWIAMVGFVIGGVICIALYVRFGKPRTEQ